jgi:hypothetical protein
MKKVKLTIEETLKYEREVIIEIPDEMTNGEIESELDYAERNGGREGIEGIVYSLRRRGMENPDGFDMDTSSPDSIDAEILDYEVIDEDEA